MQLLLKIHCTLRKMTQEKGAELMPRQGTAGIVLAEAVKLLTYKNYGFVQPPLSSFQCVFLIQQL